MDGRRVLICTGIYPPETGGPAIYVRSLVHGLYERGVPVSVVTYGDPACVRDEPWRVVTISREAHIIWRYLRYFWATCCAAREASVVYIQGPISDGLPATLAAMLARRPTVMKIVGDHAWEMYMQRVPNGALLDDFVGRQHGGVIGLVQRLQAFTVRHAQAVIVPSRYLKGIVERWGVLATRIQIIYTRIQALPEAPSYEDARAKLGISSDARICFTAVRGVPWKGVPFLIDVMKSLPPQYRLVNAGEGPCIEEWKQEAQKKGVGERVQLLGRIDRQTMALWYRAADAFVLASSYEGFPHVVVEAVAEGLPCFVSDRAGNVETKDLFPDHVSILPYEDLAAWSAALSALPPRQAPTAPLPFSDVVTATLALLKKYSL